MAIFEMLLNLKHKSLIELGEAKLALFKNPSQKIVNHEREYSSVMRGWGGSSPSDVERAGALIKNFFR